MTIDNFKNTLNNKLILITGAGGGIGFETAKYFAEMGATIIILEINKEKGILAEKDINSKCPGKAEFYHIDLADEKSIFAMKDYILNKHGCPDIIFNNAAILHLGQIDKVSSEAWDNGYLVNFKAPLLLVKSFLPEMKKKTFRNLCFCFKLGCSSLYGAL